MAWSTVTLEKSKSGAFAARKAIPTDVRDEKLRVPAGVSPHEAKARYGEWLAEIETRITVLPSGANDVRSLGRTLKRWRSDGYPRLSQSDLERILYCEQA